MEEHSKMKCLDKNRYWLVLAIVFENISLYNRFRTFVQCFGRLEIILVTYILCCRYFWGPSYKETEGVSSANMYPMNTGIDTRFRTYLAMLCPLSTFCHHIIIDLYQFNNILNPFDIMYQITSLPNSFLRFLDIKSSTDLIM